MKTLTALLLMSAFLGCVKKEPKVPSLHVLNADTCDRWVEGTIGNKEYGLRVQDGPLYVACWGPIGMADVGKDFPAAVDFARGVMTVTVSTPNGPRPQRYAVEYVREVTHEKN